MRELHTDILIIGGGIAGLWSLARLRQAGYRALLVESAGLGGVQSIASQGIIHGGAKYALVGKLTDSAKAIGDMPRIWRECLEGRGELDLSQVQVLAEHQLLWSTDNLVSRAAGFFASKLMQSRMGALPRTDFPPPFDHADFHGSLYRLEEPVLDTASLARAIVEQFPEAFLQAEVALDPETPTRVMARLADGDSVQIHCQRLVLSAGEGNETLLAQLRRETPVMQRRPLHMAMVKGDLPPVYAHCLGAGTNPRVTVSSYPGADGRWVWYLGGVLSEAGVERERDDLIAHGRAELSELLPWIDFHACEWATLRLQRAEIATPGGHRPEQPYVATELDVTTIWPTKLAFAPKAAALLLEDLQQADIQPWAEMPDTAGLPRPPLARPPWDLAEWS